MKKLLVLVLALCLVLSMVASASALTIAFSQIGQESDWRTANTDSVTAAIEGHEGWEFVYSDGQQKQENQIQALRNFITQGVDYILFTGVVTSGWDEVLTEVNEAEIPLILLDRIPDCADKIEYKAAFGGDFPLEGRRQIQWAAKYLESLGKTENVKVAIMEGTTGSDAQVGRTEGNLAALKDYPWMEVVGQQTDRRADRSERRHGPGRHRRHQGRRQGSRQGHHHRGLRLRQGCLRSHRGWRHERHHRVHPPVWPLRREGHRGPGSWRRVRQDRRASRRGRV